MTLARILGLILAPTGVLVGAWAVSEILAGRLNSGGWVSIAAGVALSFALILVGVKYLFAKPARGRDGGS